MSFTRLYRGSFYLMLVCATLVLSIDATDSRLAMLYPVAVAIAGAVAFTTIDRRPGTGISPSFGSLLALGASGLALIEYLLDRNLLLLALGHWLVYLQLIYIFRAKSTETDWWMFSLGLVQVMVGAVISQDDTLGATLLCWAVLALWVLWLFSLQRDAERARAEAPSGVAGASAPDAEPYPGLLNAAFLLSAARVTLTTLALGGVIFLAMPRRPGSARTFRGQSHAQHLTGFDDEVQLGQLGEILENDSVVMSVELFDERDTPIVPRDDWEPLWRGATMSSYERGRWKRQDRRTSPDMSFQAAGFSSDEPQASSGGRIRQQIKLEPNDSNVLFGLRPIIDVKARRGGSELSPIDGTIFRSDPRPGAYDYQVRSYRDVEIDQPHEDPLSPYHKYLLLDLPDSLREKLRTIAQGAIDEYAHAQGLTPEQVRDNRTRARALEWYLRGSGKFGYTLKLDVIDSSIDPVEDFLVNRKEGHCEYFASALALMLRSVGIPSRMVNGFKGGDWNGLAQIVSVRQKHAHSWVEAYLGEHRIARPIDSRGEANRGATENPDEHQPIWLALDPTPSLERERSVAQVGGLARRIRPLTDLIRYVWVFYIVGYDAERQNRLIYGPIRAVALYAKDGFALMGESGRAVRNRLLQWLHFPTTRSFFSVRGFLVSFAALCLVYLTGLLLYRLCRRLWVRFVGDGPDPATLAPGASQYRRLALLLADYGLERPPAETQDEFARRATVFLTGRGSRTEPVADVPRLVVEAFYCARFGHRDLPALLVANLESRLDALEQTLRASQA